MMKKKQTFRKVLMYVILIMIAVGFTIPGFLELGNEQEQAATKRICRSDADCYLVCNEKPQAALCYQNLCQQNSCKEIAYYPFQKAKNQVKFAVSIDGKKMNLKERFDELQLKNFFVQFQEASFVSLAPSLDLNMVLEKLNSKIVDKCLTWGNQTYCEGDNKTLKMWVNGNTSYSYGNYVFQNNDKIDLDYS